MSPPPPPPLVVLQFIVMALVLILRPTTARAVPARTTHPHAWQSFEQLMDARRGTNLTGTAELKRYLHRFGYLPAKAAAAFNNEFDEGLEAAVGLYQSKLGLNVTRRLDSATVSQIMTPRCGVSDEGGATVAVRPSPATAPHAVGHFAFFPGRPEWSGSRPIALTYAFSPRNSISYISQEKIRAAFQRSFSRWSAIIPVTFTETIDYMMADIRIGFYTGNHGDGVPFDGVLGVLAHAFSPESGRLHLDASETWSVDFGAQKANTAIDLESVVTHEIGHVLGLAHSSMKEAVMYPSLGPRTKKVDLRLDDVEGAQALYGTNPTFKYSSLAQLKASHSTTVTTTMTTSTITMVVMVALLIGV